MRSYSKKLTFRCRRNDRATMRIVLKKTTVARKIACRIYGTPAGTAGRVTLGTKVAIV